MAERLSCLQSYFFQYLFILICFICTVPQTCCEKRKITIIDHKCPSDIPECANEDIYQVFAVSRNDTIQYLWSTIGVPSIVVAYFSKAVQPSSSTLKVNWKELLSSKSYNAIQFNPASDYISSVAFSNLYEFTDPKNEVYLVKSPEVHRHSLDKVQWQKPTVFENGILFKGTLLNGSVALKCIAEAEENRDKQLPHQRYNQNMTRFWLSVDNLSPSTKKTRLAIEFQSLTEPYKNRKTKTCLQAQRSIDDEYTPSIFKTIYLDMVASSSKKSFISWKPVAYGQDFTFKEQTLMYEYINGKHVSPTQKCDELMTQLTSSIAKGIAGAVMQGPPVVKAMNISFGVANDGFYQKNPYLTWCGEVGYGKPLVDSISTTALIIIFTSLGIPVLLMFLGSIYLCVRKYREQQIVSKYGQIN